MNDPRAFELTDIVKFYLTEEALLNSSLKRDDALYVSKNPLSIYHRKNNGELEKFPHIENSLIVAKSGGDFTNIKDAVDSVSSTVKTTILMYPGTYLEDNPIQGKSEVTIKAVGGQNTVNVVAKNANENLFDAVNTFFLEDLILSGVTGASNYAVEMTSFGAVLLSNILFSDCSNGVHANNAASQIIIRNIAFVGIFTKGVFVEAGNIIVDLGSVSGSSTLETIIEITGSSSIATLNNILSFSSNVTTGIKILNSARVVSYTSSLVAMYDGIVIDSGSNLRANALTIFNAQNDAVRIDNNGTGTTWNCNGCTLKDSEGYDINVLSNTAILSGIGETNIDNINFVSGAQIYGIMIDDKEDDEGTNVLGELHVGLPEKGYESCLGEGDSYTRGMLVYTETSGGVFTDISELAKSASGSTFTFPDVAADNAIYIASSLSNEAGVLEHYGIKTKVNTAAVKGSGEIVIEYYNGATWVEENGSEIGSSNKYFPHAKDYFQNTGSYHIRYNSKLAIDNWTKNDPIVPALGTNYCWIRFRIKTAITTAPIFEQFKLHTSRFEPNADGWLEYFGKSRPIGQLPLSIGGDRAFTGLVRNQSIWINQNLASGLIENRFLNTTGYIGRYFFIPFDLDTSSPIELKFAGLASNTTTIEFVAEIGHVTSEDSAYTTNPSLLPGKITASDSKSVVAGKITIFTISLDVSDVISRRDTEDSDFVCLSIHASNITGTFDLMALEATYTKWCEGGHI